MTIKQLGGVFGRNPTFNDVTIEGQLTFDGDIDVNSDLKVDGNLEVTGTTALSNNLTMTTAGNANIEANRTAGAGVRTQAQSATGLIGTHTNHNFRLMANGTQRMEVTTGGNFQPVSDNVSRLGNGANRFTIVYATTGTINTSDEREKQQIRELSDAERLVATRAKGLLKAFKFNHAVEQKGDGARIHVGVIAQELDAAFTAQGLNANDYGMFCSDTWWTDADGKIYDQAGDGLTEHTRLGVRYDQLLAFIISTL